MNKWTLTLLLAALCTLPTAAQVNNGGTTHARPVSKTAVTQVNAGGQHSDNRSLETQVERTVLQATQARSQQPCTCNCASHSATISEADRINAETELQLIRNYDPSATFETYPFLLDPAYRHQRNCACACHQAAPADIPAIFTADDDDRSLSTHELIEAEEELSLIRSRVDDNATFEQYPYLLDPTYRRADKTQQDQIHRQYSRTKKSPLAPAYERGETWANKVWL